MTSVKINKTSAQAQTPSAEIIQAAIKEQTVSDASGRQIKLRKPGPLAQFRLVEAAGDAARNQTYMGMALPLIYVESIDGAPVPAISTKSQLEALINRLGDDGITAVMKAVQEMYGEQDPDGDKEKLKN